MVVVLLVLQYCSIINIEIVDVEADVKPLLLLLLLLFMSYGKLQYIIIYTSLHIISIHILNFRYYQLINQEA